MASLGSAGATGRLHSTGVSPLVGTGRCRAPGRRQQRQQHPRTRPAATQEEASKADDSPTPVKAPPEVPLLASERPGGKEPVKGQGTAIVTGIFSIACGVLYLALVQLMSTRGDQLQPPPPEAFQQ